MASLPPAGFAVLLIASAAFAWILAADARPSARPDIRFAAVLFAALGWACFLAAFLPGFGPVADAVALLVAPLAALALALASLAASHRVPSRLVASLALLLGCMAGLLSAVTGLALPSLAVSSMAALVMFIAVPGRFREGVLAGSRLAVAALAFFAGGLCLLKEQRSATEIFFAAGLLGLALALRAGRPSNPPVEKKGGLAPLMPIGPLR